MTKSSPDSPEPSDHTPPSSHETESLSSYDRAVIEFDRANAELLDTACEMVAYCSETGEISEDIVPAALGTILGMRKLLVETCRNNGEDQQVTQIVREFLIAHYAERVDLFNQMTREGYFRHVDDETMDILLTTALAEHGVGEKFVHEICDTYAAWLQSDLEMLAEAIVNKYERREKDAVYDDSTRMALVSGFYDFLAIRLRLWPEYDSQNPDHVRLMSKKLTIDAAKLIGAQQLRPRGEIIIEGCSIVTNGTIHTRIAGDSVATGVWAGFGIGPVYVYDEQESDVIKTHDLGLQLIIAQPDVRDATGDRCEFDEEIDMDILAFPIMNDSVRMRAEKIVLN